VFRQSAGLGELENDRTPKSIYKIYTIRAGIARSIAFANADPVAVAAAGAGAFADCLDPLISSCRLGHYNDGGSYWKPGLLNLKRAISNCSVSYLMSANRFSWWAICWASALLSALVSELGSRSGFVLCSGGTACIFEMHRGAFLTEKVRKNYILAKSYIRWLC